MGKKCTCEVCKKKCKTLALKVEDKFYHAECFKCKICHKQLPKDCFYKRAGEWYCESDFYSLFGTWCSNCSKRIDKEVVNVSGKSYHPGCFLCFQCREPITTGETAVLSENNYFCHACIATNAASKEPNESQEKVEVAGKDCSFDENNDDACKKELCAETNLLPDTSEVKLSCAADGAVSESSPARNDLRMDNGKKSDSSHRNSSTFGMPKSKFYNISYLDKAETSSFKRFPSIGPSSRPKSGIHFHLPNGGKTRADDLEKKVVKDSELLNDSPANVHSHSSNKHEHLKKFEEIDFSHNTTWLGPPEPAAAYPELWREDDSEQLLNISNDGGKKEDPKLQKEITELEKLMNTSGTAKVLLMDLKTHMDNVVDPRDVSRDPSAENPLHVKLRYNFSRLASPSLNLGKISRPGSSATMPRNFSMKYNSTSYGEKMEQQKPDSLSTSLNNPEKDILMDSYYKEKTAVQLKSLTLPARNSFNISNFIDRFSTPTSNSPKPYKKFTLAEFEEERKKQPGRFDVEHLENHLSDEDFERVFKMPREEFIYLPPWKKFEVKQKIQLA